MNLFSLIALFSYFAFFAKGYPLPVKAAYLKYGGRPQSQSTRCGHTLTRCPLPGLATLFIGGRLSREREE